MLAPEDLATRQLLAYQATLSKMSAAEWPKEATRLGDGNGALDDAMKLALVLAHTHASGDLSRAQALLDKVLANPSVEAQAWQGLARMLSALFAEQRRNEEQIDRLNQQLRDTQRDNQRKLDQLNEKLEALKSIERSLNNRIPVPTLSAPSPATVPSAPGPTAKPAPRP
jgi:predicted ribosome quality control (RQC) complex YloA/Tae2 family protein